jgi:hypothetical protein
MTVEYFEIILEWSPDQPHVAKHLNLEPDMDPLQPWYTALSNIYGIQTNNYDGYVSKVIYDAQNPTSVKVVFYVMEDEKKTQTLRAEVQNWNAAKFTRIEAAIRRHLDCLNSKNQLNISRFRVSPAYA